MLKLCVYIPAAQLELVKTALFAAGAGRIGNYDSCAWQVKGMGQFRPLEGSSPWLGEQGNVEQVEEYRVEMVLKEADLPAVLEALQQSHPYEEPAFDVIQMLDVSLP